MRKQGQRGEMTHPRSYSKWQVCVAVPNACEEGAGPELTKHGPGPRKCLTAGYAALHLLFIEIE